MGVRVVSAGSAYLCHELFQPPGSPAVLSSVVPRLQVQGNISTVSLGCGVLYIGKPILDGPRIEPGGCRISQGVRRGISDGLGCRSGGGVLP